MDCQSQTPGNYTCICDETSGRDREPECVLGPENHGIRQDERQGPHDVDVAVVLLGLAKEKKTSLGKEN